MPAVTLTAAESNLAQSAIRLIGLLEQMCDATLAARASQHAAPSDDWYRAYEKLEVLQHQLQCAALKCRDAFVALEHEYGPVTVTVKPPYGAERTHTSRGYMHVNWCDILSGRLPSIPERNAMHTAFRDRAAEVLRTIDAATPHRAALPMLGLWFRTRTPPVYPTVKSPWRDHAFCEDRLVTDAHLRTRRLTNHPLG